MYSKAISCVLAPVPIDSKNVMCQGWHKHEGNAGERMQLRASLRSSSVKGALLSCCYTRDFRDNILISQVWISSVQFSLV